MGVPEDGCDDGKVWFCPHNTQHNDIQFNIK